jgi:hypothetical protein
MGFLKAGEAGVGDRIVTVPGCYNHLNLRRQDLVAGVRWKLVGLIVMGTTNKTSKASCLETDWARYRREGGLFEYSIV